MLTSAKVTLKFGKPEIALEFNDEGRYLLQKLTRDLAPGGAQNSSPNGRRNLPVVLDDDTLYAAPWVKTEIPGDHASISGNFTEEEARILVNVLRAGRLPCPLSLLSVTPAP